MGDAQRRRVECTMGEERSILPHLPPGILVSKRLKKLLDVSVLWPSAAHSCARASWHRSTVSIAVEARCGSWQCVGEKDMAGVSEILGWHRLLWATVTLLDLCADPQFLRLASLLRISQGNPLPALDLELV